MGGYSTCEVIWPGTFSAPASFGIRGCLRYSVASGAIRCQSNLTYCEPGQYIERSITIDVYNDDIVNFNDDFLYSDNPEMVSSVDSGCVSTPAGYFNPSTSGMMLYICPRGSYSLPGSSFCNSCPKAVLPGAAYCPNSVVPTICGAGLHAVFIANDYVCFPAPPGFYNPLPAHNVYYSCSPGYYSSGGAQSCTPCEQGSVSVSPGASFCTPCSAGYSSAEGSAECVMCGVGYYSQAGGQCQPCPPGSIGVDVGSTVCQLVSAGYYNPYFAESSERLHCFLSNYPGAVNCDLPSYSTNCSAGTYSFNEDCATVPAGYYNPNVQSAIIYLCPLGKYSTAGSSICSPCPASLVALGAAFCNAENVTACDVYNYFDGNECVPTPAGFYQLADTRVFYSCPYSTYSQAGYDQCVDCQQLPANEYGIAQINAATCDSVFCPGSNIGGGVSSRRRLNGDLEDASCLPCDSGYFNSGDGCEACPVMSYSPLPIMNVNQNVCKQCPLGSYTSSVGSSFCEIFDPAMYYLFVDTNDDDMIYLASSSLPNANCPYSSDSGIAFCQQDNLGNCVLFCLAFYRLNRDGVM